MPEESLIRANQYLDQIATELDISDTDFKEAEEHYLAIGEWLGGDGSNLAVYRPVIYPQGSFALGTVVKPLGRDEYDIDLVCHLSISPSAVTPVVLKKLVGERLRQHGTYATMIEEKNRCWRLNYAGEFHMDILPAIPDNSRGTNAILIPDRQLSCWTQSNPKGFAAWFGQRMIVQLTKLAEARGANVQDLPVYSVRTPLQRAIQLLKRHRDSRFNGGALADDKPISMIITTLAAQIYQGEADIFSAMTNIVNTLAAYSPLLVQGGQVQERIAKMGIIAKGQDSRWYIPNPVNPDENFADKWHEDKDRKAKAFFQWVSWLQTDLPQILSHLKAENISPTLKAAFGSTVVERAVAAMKSTSAAAAPSVSAPHVIIENPSKPWMNHGR